MVNSTRRGGGGGVERRAENQNVRDIIDDKLQEVEERRDRNLHSKVEAMEKYINLMFITKSEALGVAISRMQCDNEKCTHRCTEQVNKFYALINAIKEKDVSRDHHIQTLNDAIHAINKDMADLEEYHDKDVLKTSDAIKKALEILEIKIADLAKYHDADVTKNENSAKECEKEIRDALDEMNKRMDGLDRWKTNYWVKNITVAVCASVATSQLFFYGFTWIVDFISKTRPPTP